MNKDRVKLLQEVRRNGNKNIVNKTILKLFHDKYNRAPTKKEFIKCGGFLEAVETAYVDYDAFVSFWGYEKTISFTLSIEDMMNVDTEEIKNAVSERAV